MNTSGVEWVDRVSRIGYSCRRPGCTTRHRGTLHLGRLEEEFVITLTGTVGRGSIVYTREHVERLIAALERLIGEEDGDAAS
jgi:hypothetical protein